MKLTNFKNLNNKGIGLVEAVLSIAFAIILVVALLSLTTLNVQNSLNITERQEATKDTGILLERLRSDKDSSFEVFYNTYKSCTPTNLCYFTNSTGTATSICSYKKDSVCFGISTEANPSLPVSELKINIVSYYEISKSLFSSSTETIFTNWRTRE